MGEQLEDRLVVTQKKLLVSQLPRGWFLAYGRCFMVAMIATAIVHSLGRVLGMECQTTLTEGEEHKTNFRASLAEGTNLTIWFEKAVDS